MSSRRQSSSSQGNRWNGDYTWTAPTVDGCGRQLNDLSLVTPTGPLNSDYPADSTSYWDVSGYPRVSRTHQPSFANPRWGSGDYQTFGEPEQILLPSNGCPQFDAGSLSGLGHDNFMGGGEGYTTSTHVSPSSSSPGSKRSTMDDFQGTRGYRDDRKPERNPSRSGVTVQEKKKKRHQGNHHHGASGSSRKNNSPFDWGKSDARCSPYPPAILDSDCYDLPVSSSNDAGPHTAQCIHTESHSEEDYDRCDSVGSPFTIIGTPDYVDMPETSS